MSQEVPDEESESPAFDAYAFTFPPGGPDVSITGLDVNRSQLSVDPDQNGPTQTELAWAVTGLVGPPRARPHLVLIGDLQARREQWFAGCTVVAHVDFREESMRPEAGDETAISIYAAWGSSVMYDFASARIRSMVSASHACEIEVQRATPKADLDAMTATLNRDTEDVTFTDGRDFTT